MKNATKYADACLNILLKDIEKTESGRRAGRKFLASMNSINVKKGSVFSGVCNSKIKKNESEVNNEKS